MKVCIAEEGGVSQLTAGSAATADLRTKVHIPSSLRCHAAGLGPSSTALIRLALSRHDSPPSDTSSSVKYDTNSVCKLLEQILKCKNTIQ